MLYDAESGAKRDLCDWPELQSEWAPLAVELATDCADEFVSKVQKMPDYATLGYAKKREEELIKISMQLEATRCAWSDCWRASETAVLAANLSKIAKPEIVHATSSCSKWKRARSQIRRAVHRESTAAAGN